MKKCNLLFSLFLLIFLCPTHSNGTKAVYFKVLWSVFEENADLYNATPEHRFRITLKGLDDEGNAILTPKWFVTDQFDVRGYDIGNNVHAMDVKIKMNEKDGEQVASRQLVYEENKIFILPFLRGFSPPIETVPFDTSIFAKPVRHFHFVVLGNIMPILIECVESVKPKKVSIWSHEFNGNSHLHIQEAVCQSDKYKFTYKSRENPKNTNKEIVCAEPIYELGFVNRFDIVHNEKTKKVTCHPNRENGIQPSVQVEFPISNYSAEEATRRAPFLAEYKKKIEKVLANYEELKKTGKNKADEGTSMNNPPPRPLNIPGWSKEFVEGVFKYYNEQVRGGQGQQQQGMVIGKEAAELPQLQQAGQHQIEQRIEPGRHEIGQQHDHIHPQNFGDEEEGESTGSTGLFEAQNHNDLAHKGKEVIDLTADTPEAEEENVYQQEILVESQNEPNMQIERHEEVHEHAHGHGQAGGSGHQQVQHRHGKEAVTAPMEREPQEGGESLQMEEGQQIQPVSAGDEQAYNMALSNTLRELSRNLSLSVSSHDEPIPEEPDLAENEVEQPVGSSQSIMSRQSTPNLHANVMIGQSSQLDPLSEIFLQLNKEALQNQSYRPNVGNVQPEMQRTMHSGKITSHHGASTHHLRHPNIGNPPLIINQRPPPLQQVQAVHSQIGPQLQRQGIQGVPAGNVAGMRPTGMDPVRQHYDHLFTPGQSMASGSTTGERRNQFVGQKRQNEIVQNMANIRPRTYLSTGTIPRSAGNLSSDQEARNIARHIIVGAPVMYNHGRNDEQMPHISQRVAPVNVQQPGVEPGIHSSDDQHRIDILSQSQRQNPVTGAVQRANPSHGTVITGNPQPGAVQRPHSSGQQFETVQRSRHYPQQHGPILESSQPQIQAVQQQHSAKRLRDSTSEAAPSLQAAKRPLFIPRQVSFNSRKGGESSSTTKVEPGINELPPLKKECQMIATLLRLKEIEEEKAKKYVNDEAKKKISLEEIRKYNEQVEGWKQKGRQIFANTIRLREYKKNEAKLCVDDEARKKTILEKIRELNGQIEEWNEIERKIL